MLYLAISVSGTGGGGGGGGGTVSGFHPPLCSATLQLPDRCTADTNRRRLDRGETKTQDQVNLVISL